MKFKLLGLIIELSSMIQTLNNNNDKNAAFRFKIEACN